MTSDKQKAHTVQIDVHHAGQRIDNYLMTHLKGVPRSHVYQLLRSGQVRVNSGRKKPHYKLLAGDTVRIPPVHISEQNKPAIPDAVINTLMAAKLFENDDLLVFNKPSGLAVHSGSGLSFGVIEALKANYPDQFLELVHRLDRETSGILLLAKNRASLTRLHELLRNEKSGIGKYYLALVEGCWHGNTTVDAPLIKTRRSGEHMVEIGEDGQSAVSHFESLRVYENSSLMRIRIETGRTHQIRVHASQAGHPVAGDEKYGNAEFNRMMKKTGLKRLFLHASRVVIPALEPGKISPIIIEAPLDETLQHLLDKLEA